MQIQQLVTGIGLINQDLVAFVPSWERDEKVTASELLHQVGGPIPVALFALARLGGIPEIAFIGTVADDAEGSEIIGFLNHAGVHTDCLIVRGGKTSQSLVVVDERDGSRNVANYPGSQSSGELTATQIALLERTTLLHLDGRDLVMSLRAAEIVRGNGGWVSFDLGTMRPEREKLIAKCDIVLASQKGGAGAFPDVAEDPIEQVRRFQQSGVKIAGVTLGSRGVAIAGEGVNPVHLPAILVPKPADTCGAGDTFHGAFLWAHLQGYSVIECAQFAQAAVAHRIRHRGNDKGLPYREDVQIS